MKLKNEEEVTSEPNDLGNGLFMLRMFEDVPKLAVQLDPENSQYGWLFHRVGALWVAQKKLSRLELIKVQEQVDNHIVYKGFGKSRRWRGRRV